MWNVMTFDCGIGGALGPSYSLRLLPNGALEYHATNGMKREASVVSPSADAWLRFYSDCKKIGIERWESDYSDKNSCDGTFWRLRIGIGDISYEGKGRNDYPSGFDDMLMAIQNLIGGLNFK